MDKKLEYRNVVTILWRGDHVESILIQELKGMNSEVIKQTEGHCMYIMYRGAAIK